MSEEKNNPGSNFSTFISGVIFGAVLTYLFTTESGKKIKTELLKEGSKILDNIKPEIEKVKAELEDKTKEVRKQMSEKAEDLKEDVATAVDQAEDILREAPAQVAKIQKKGRRFFFSKKSSPES